MKLALAAVVFGLAFTACGNTPGRAPDQDYGNFVTAIAHADRDGYTPYWLGREFTAGGLTFTGPATGDFGDEVTGGGVQYLYHADVPPGPGSVSLRVTVYNRSAWDKVAAAQSAVASMGTTATDVTIAGGSGVLLESHNRLGTLEQVRLVLHVGDTTVLATANHTYSATPAPDVNPLADKATFISVLRDLRPYPQ